MRLPDGWTKTNLAEKLLILKDGTHFSPQSKSGSFMYLTSKNIRFGKLDLSNISFISEDEHNKIYKGSPVKYGDVLLTKDGANTGNAAINIIENEFSLLSSVAFLRGKPNVLLNEFLLHLLLSKTGQSIIKSEMAGQAITRLTLKKIGDLFFIFPTFPEQQKIAQILSTWDKATEKLEALIAAKQKRKKALMQQLLTGKKRFAEFDDKWKEHKLKSLADSNVKHSFIDGDWIESPYITDNGVRLIQTGNISVGKFKNKNKRYISHDSFSELKCKEVNIGNILICRLAEPAGRACLVPDICEEKMITSVDVTIIKANDNKIIPYYLVQFFSLRHTLYTVESLCGGSTRSRISRTNLGNIKIKLPSIKEQQKIASILSTADKEIETHQKHLAVLKQQKQGLMQQLLTGKKRVKVA